MDQITALSSLKIKKKHVGLPGGPVVRNLPASAGGVYLIPDLDMYLIRSHVAWSN